MRDRIITKQWWADNLCGHAATANTGVAVSSESVPRLSDCYLEQYALVGGNL